MSASYGVEIKNGDEVIKALQLIAQKVTTGVTPAMRDVADHIAETSRLGFDEQQDPWGNPWKELAQSTKDRRRGTPPYQILRDTSALINSINGTAEGDTARVGAGTGPSRDYARIHLFGGRAGRGRSTRIPARPYLPVTENGVELPREMEDDLLKILYDHLEDG